MRDLIVFATFWNEIEWIRPSLEQILQIDPIEIIICDGNFDPNVKNYSTDGTREIVKKFVKENSSKARMINAIRTNRLNRGIRFLKNAGYSKDGVKPSRLKYALASQFKINEYRVNQALTFSKMLNISKKWKIGRWVMTYDADQYYSDELINAFSITNEKTNYDIITADEYTFPFDFLKYTKDYEKRKWNNLPFKIRKNMAIYPTRHFVIEEFFNFKMYHEIGKPFHAGNYHHYKFRSDINRLNEGYSLGDRSRPENDRFTNLMKFEGNYPSTIKENFKI